MPTAPTPSYSQTDSFGNTGTASLSFTLDTTAPVVAIGSSGGATNQAAQTITGTVDTADAGTTVTLFDNGSATALGTVTVGERRQLEHRCHTIGQWQPQHRGQRYRRRRQYRQQRRRGLQPEHHGRSETLTEALSIDTGTSSSDRITGGTMR